MLNVRCQNTDCVYQGQMYCKLTIYNTNEILSIGKSGECLSFSDDEDDI